MRFFRPPLSSVAPDLRISPAEILQAIPLVCLWVSVVPLSLVLFVVCSAVSQFRVSKFRGADLLPSLRVSSLLSLLHLSRSKTKLLGNPFAAPIARELQGTLCTCIPGMMIINTVTSIPHFKYQTCSDREHEKCGLSDHHTWCTTTVSCVSYQPCNT